MNARDYLAELQQLFPDGAAHATTPRRFWVNVPPGELAAAVLRVREKLGITHLSTIVGEDMRDAFLLQYILSGEVVVILGVRIDRDEPKIPSLADTVKGAVVYERELHDLFGIVPVGHPDLRRQILPEDWPDGVYPLRKDVKLQAATAEAAPEKEE